MPARPFCRGRRRGATLSRQVLLASGPWSGAFTRGRDFSAWMGLTPRQHSSGGSRSPRGALEALAPPAETRPLRHNGQPYSGTRPLPRQQFLKPILWMALDP
ncbi:transposase, partial [Rhizobium tibeticum]